MSVDPALDAAVRRISAIPSFSTLVDDIRRTGYVPTVRTDDCSCHGRGGNVDCAWRRACRLVRMHLAALSLDVYPPYGRKPVRHRRQP